MFKRALRKPFRIIPHAGLLLVATAALTLGGCSPRQPEAGKPPLAGADIGGAFTLIDKNGKTVHWADLRGRYTTVYFGYTFCPDACPLDMQALIKAYNAFAKAHPKRAAKIQPLFITIDPARDTPSVIGEWTSAFSPKLMGLTGTPAQIRQAADNFAVYYRRGASTPGGGYLMDHTRATYLMGPSGAPIALLPVEQGPEAVERVLQKWVK